MKKVKALKKKYNHTKTLINQLLMKPALQNFRKKPYNIFTFCNLHFFWNLNLKFSYATISINYYLQLSENLNNGILRLQLTVRHDES